MRRRIAVVGGGLLGLTSALLAAHRGYQVVVFEREPELFTRASANNEGKVHLGLVYALADSATLQVMLEGALSFSSVLDEACGRALPWSELSTRCFSYLVMPDSLLGVEQLGRFYERANDHFSRSFGGSAHSYVGESLSRLVDPMPQSDEATGLPAYRTNERAVDPRALGAILVAAVERHPGIETLVGTHVDSLVQDDEGIILRGAAGALTARFDAVLNCAWEGRQALLPPAARSVLNFRVKTAVRIPLEETSRFDRVSTLVIGPYGDVVTHRDHVYASWYPVARTSNETAELPTVQALQSLDPSSLTGLAAGQLEALSVLGLLPESSGQGEVEVVGGFILGEGRQDIHQPRSGLHRRASFGTHVEGRILTPTNFKFSTAPLAASGAVRRLVQLLA